MDTNLRGMSDACKMKQGLAHVMAQLGQRALQSMQGMGLLMSNPRGLRLLNEDGETRITTETLRAVCAEAFPPS
jgi:hypothetical protein